MPGLRLAHLPAFLEVCQSVVNNAYSLFNIDEGCADRGRRHRKGLQLSSDENWLSTPNLSDAVKEPGTYAMSLWPGMMANCNFPEK